MNLISDAVCRFNVVKKGMANADNSTVALKLISAQGNVSAPQSISNLQEESVP